MNIIFVIFFLTLKESKTILVIVVVTHLFESMFHFFNIIFKITLYILYG